VNLLTRLLRREPEIARYSWDQYANDVMVSFQGQRYLLSGGSTGWTKTEDIETSFTGYINSIYKSNGVVFAIILARMLLFSEARFCWWEVGDNGENARTAGREGLEVLEQPWPNCSTGELLARMEQDVSLGGNFYAVREANRLRRLRPDWVTIVLTAPPAEAVYSDVAGYWYHPGRSYTSAGEPGPGDDVYLPDEVTHFSPIPDPDAQYRGMSWLTPVVREVMADKSAMEHKLKFFENGASFGTIISAKENLTNAQFKEWKANFEGLHTGSANAYRTLFLASPVDTSITTADMRQLDFKVTIGAGETRLCAAGGVPPIIVGLSEGLASSTYSNYGLARRKFGDGWAHPQWRMVASALSSVVEAPNPDLRLGVNTRGIAFLREDAKEVAEIQQIKASTLSTLITAGYKPDSAQAAVDAEDFSLLEHTGLTSVQLLPPGQDPEAMDPDLLAEEEAADEEEYDVLLEEFRAHLFDEDEIQRDRYDVRNPAGSVGGGRFRKLSDAIVALLKDWNGEGDPLKDYKQPQLKKAAEQLGIDVPPRSTAPKLKSLILQHHGGRRGAPESRKPAKKAVPKKATQPNPATVRRRLLELDTNEERREYLDSLGPLTQAQANRLAKDLGAQQTRISPEATLDNIVKNFDTSPDTRHRMADERDQFEGSTLADTEIPAKPDSVTQARQRQADIDTARGFSDAASQLDEMLANGASTEAVLARLDASGKRHGTAEDLAPVRAAVEAGDTDKAREALDRILSSRGITQDSKAGDSARFTPGQHQPIGDLREGQPVEVVRPGFTLSRDGEQIRLTKATVEAADEPVASPSYVPSRAERARERSRLQRTGTEDLRDELAAKGLPTDGNKPELVKRLMDNFEGDPATAATRHAIAEFEREHGHHPADISHQVFRPGFGERLDAGNVDLSTHQPGQWARVDEPGVDAAVYANGPHQVVIRNGSGLTSSQVREVQDAADDLLASLPLVRPYKVVVNPRGEHRDAGHHTPGTVQIWADVFDGNDERPGHYMPSVDRVSYLQYVLTHEFGHAMDYRKDHPGGQNDGIDREHERSLSGYSRQGSHEAYAEAFAEWVLTGGSSTNPAVREYADRYGWRTALASGTRDDAPPAPDLSSLDTEDLRAIAEAEGIPLPKRGSREQLTATIRDFRFHRDNPTASTFARPEGIGDSAGLAFPTAPRTASDVQGSIRELRDIAEAEGIPLPRHGSREQLAAVIRDFRFHRDNPTAAFFVDPETGIAGATDLASLDTEDLRDTLDLKSVDQLKEMIRERNKTGAKIRVSGRKRELVDRLVDDMAGRGGAAPQAPTKRAPRKATPTGRPPATPVPIHDLLDADDATIEAALRDVYEGQFGPYTTKVTRVGIRRAGTRTDSRGRVHPVDPEIFVEGSIFGPDGVAGGSIGKFGRSIGPTNLHYADGTVRREVWAQHSIVEIDPEFQGKGFGGHFNRRVIEWYRASGVHGITQDDHNFYVWASQGFDFRGGIVSQQATEAMRDLIASLRAGKTKFNFGDTIPKRLRDAPDLDAQIAAAEALLARLESTSPGQPGYPTAYEISQLGRRSGQRGRTAVWFGKLIPVAADELILNPDEGEVISG
jgi:phage portal protein BeeE